jgi:hypothetical protein
MELTVELGPAQRGRGLGNLRTDLRRGGGQLIEPVQEGLVVEHGAAHDQGLSTTRSNLRDSAQDIGMAPGDRVVDLWRDQVDQVVSHGSLLGGTWLRSANVEPAVDLG